MVHTAHFRSFSSINAALCVLITAVSYAPVSMAVNPQGKTFCAKTFLARHKTLAISAALLSTAAMIAKPTEGEYEVSQDLLMKDAIKWMRNVLGWFPKDTKIEDVIEVDGEQVPVYKKGWKGKGFLGTVHHHWKTLKAVGGLYLLFKELDPSCDTMNFFVNN